MNEILLMLKNIYLLIFPTRTNTFSIALKNQSKYVKTIINAFVLSKDTILIDFPQGE